MFFVVGNDKKPQSKFRCNPYHVLPTNCLSVFDHFVGLGLKGLKGHIIWSKMGSFQVEHEYFRYFMNYVMYRIENHKIG